MNEVTVDLAGAAVLLVLSGMFSGSETALFSLPKGQLREARRSRSATGRAIAALLAKPRRLLVTLLLGNTAVNVLFFATSWTVAGELSRRSHSLGVSAGGTDWPQACP